MNDDSFVQFIEALKVNTTLSDIYLHGTFKLFRVCRYYLSFFMVMFKFILLKIMNLVIMVQSILPTY